MEAIDKRFGPMENDPVRKAGETLLQLVEYPKSREELALFGDEILHFSQECDFYNKI